MEEKISLGKIIEIVLNEKEGISSKKLSTNESYDSDARQLRRAFDRLIERLGTDKDILKNKAGKLEFEKAQIPFMKVLFKQIGKRDSMIEKFTNERNRNKKFSSKEVRDFIQALVDEAEREGFAEEDLMYMVEFLGNIFLYAPLRSIENCHFAIDAIAWSVKDLSNEMQAVYLSKIEQMLKKEAAIRVMEAPINILEIAELIESSKELMGDDIGIQCYEGHIPEIQFEYMQRDKRILQAIQEDDDLRQYIEKKLGKRAEDIFNYAASD